jgi:hypothetical protein
MDLKLCREALLSICQGGILHSILPVPKLIFVLLLKIHFVDDKKATSTTHTLATLHTYDMAVAIFH